jgi:hypothetical protein
MLNTIYVILNMHLNYNLDICPSGRFSFKKSIYKLKQKTLPSFCHVAFKATSSTCHVSVY